MSSLLAADRIISAAVNKNANRTGGAGSVLRALALSGDMPTLRVVDFIEYESSINPGNGFVSINPGGHALSAVVVDSDPTVHGVLRATLTANPAGGAAGYRRQMLDSIGIDSMGTAKPLWVGTRFRAVNLLHVPTVSDDYYVSPGGFGTQETGVGEPDDGTYVCYDRTIGVDHWVVRCSRGGVSIDIDTGLEYVTGWHDIIFRNDGSRCDAWLDGAHVGTQTGAELQPADQGQVNTLHLAQIAVGLSFNPSIDVDAMLWGFF